MMQSQSRIRLNLRGLTELVLACAFLSLITLVVWSWQTNSGHLVATEAPPPEAQRSFMTQILRHPAIMMSAIVAEFILLLSIVLALVPPAWWLRADHLFGPEPAATTTPLRWIGTQMQKIRHPQTEVAEGQAAVNEAGEPIYYEQPTMPSMAATANQFNGYTAHPTGGPVPGQPVTSQMQPGQPVAGQPMDAAATPPARASMTHPAASPPQQEVQDFGKEEADDPLIDLANITDILSSAFDEDTGVDPNLEALAHSLDEVSILTIRTTVRDVAATFNR